MKRLAVFFFVLLMMASLASGETYTLPGSTPDGKPYNNIGIVSEVMVDLNVTMVNTAPFPKFVIVNPRYDFKVIRLSGKEGMYSFRVNGTTYHVPMNLKKTSLNYFIGFWIMPYETVVVNFRIPYNNSYLITPVDYKSICGDSKIVALNYTLVNGTLYYNGKIRSSSEDIYPMTCGVMYPQLINSPKILFLRELFPLNDGYVKVLHYRGTVTLRLTNAPNEAGVFNTFFAVAVPVVFQGAKMYNFTPNYTMTYDNYMREFLWRYRGVVPPNNTQTLRSSEFDNMFTLTDTLLTGVSVGGPHVIPPKHTGLNYPVWIVFMGHSMEIRYDVEWSAG
ncbi:hypothetical protein [Thermococcus sp.]|uniref:hypothetical protein n=1 Tax=Thermococcus sp. TaxID=35749 RepID=UPI0026368BE4|nr:hypothetical protein [Thermococcus sp.]